MTIQELNFELIKRSSFNDFNGDLVVEDLLKNKPLWKGVVLDRLGSLIKLRDIDSDSWNVDTLFILPSNVDNDKLFKIASSWNADEVDWLGKDESERLLGSWNNGNTKILRVWWD